MYTQFSCACATPVRRQVEGLERSTGRVRALLETTRTLAESAAECELEIEKEITKEKEAAAARQTLLRHIHLQYTVQKLRNRNRDKLEAQRCASDTLEYNRATKTVHANHIS